MKNEHKAASIFVAILGLATLAFGIADMIVAAGGTEFAIGILEIPNDFFRGGWGGLVIACAGGLMLAGSVRISDIQQFSKALLGAILVWLIAGCDIFAMICESIPAGEESEAFFNTLDGFLSGFAPPYPPAVILLPFTLVIAYFYLTWRFDE